MLWDEANRNHKNYGIASWPTAYLIGRDGKVVWQGNPARMQDRPESLAEFRAVLKKSLGTRKLISVLNLAVPETLDQ